MTATDVLLPIVSVVDASIELRDGTRLLERADVEVRRGELIAIVGPSGSGKTTLLDILAGLRTPTTGHVHVSAPSMPFGYVPQDDIVHRELTVESTVRYAARLRLPADAPPGTVDRAVTRTLALLDLTERRHLVVGALSGGQRKRASIATELVVQPGLCVLDEPTAGLDPAAAASLMDLLRSLADTGTAIVMSTHNLADLRVADRLIVMGEGGRITFDGPPGERDAPQPMLDLQAAPRTPADRGSSRPVTAVMRQPPHHRRPYLQQAAVLARRNVELMLRNRMSLAIMAGSPVLIVAMFAALFPPHAFDHDAGDPTVAIAIVYWLAFAGFFFGLTFGLLQICTELPIVRRERLVTIDLGPYLVAKVVVLLPVLGAVNLVMMGVLGALDRLPAGGPGDALAVWIVLGLDATAGLTLGLLASASVTSPAQAALALPMLCFPAVLFSGAVLPVVSMAPIGRVIATFMSDRWAFEALGRSLRVDDGGGGTPGWNPVDLHGGALTGPIGLHVVALITLTVVFGVAARVVLRRRVG